MVKIDAQTFSTQKDKKPFMEISTHSDCRIIYLQSNETCIQFHRSSLAKINL